jgi:hypothetical protein
LKNALGGTEVVEPPEPTSQNYLGGAYGGDYTQILSGLGFVDLPEGASTYATLESLDPSKTPSLALRDQLVPGDPVTFQGEEYIVKNVKDVFAGKVLIEAEGGASVLVSLEDVIPALAFSKDAVDVGGDEWNRLTAMRLELEYQRAKPELEKLATSLVGSEAPVSMPADWESLSSDDQEKIESEWKQKNYESYYDSEVDSWQQNEAPNEAKAYVANDSSDDEWLSDAVNAWFEARTDNDDPLPPIKPEQLMEAIGVSHEYGEEKTDISFDDDALRKAMGGPEEQLSLAGIEGGDASKLLTDEMREHLREEIESALDTEAQRLLDLGRIDLPDYLGDSAQELVDSDWSEMEDSEKFEYGEKHDLIGEIETDDDDEEFHGTLDKLPEKFDPLNKAIDSDEMADYKRTQALARLMSDERAVQLLVKRGLVKDHDEAVANVRELDKTLWEAWKTSSSSDEGKLLQVVTAEELGGRLRGEAGVEKILNKYQIIKDAEASWSKIGGFDGLKTYLRAKWETTQYLLDKAGLDTLELYRGLYGVDANLSPSETAPADSPSHIEWVGGEQKLPNLYVARNGCASMTAKRSVANDWDGGDSIVLRAAVPRTAAVSIPAYGINVYSEQEVVVAGTGWKAWDAWYKSAPRFEDTPITHGPSGKHDAPPYVAPYTKKQAKEDDALLAKLDLPGGPSASASKDYLSQFKGPTTMVDHMKSSKGEEWVGLSKAGDPKLWVGTEAITQSALQAGGKADKIAKVEKGLGDDDHIYVTFGGGNVANIDYVMTKNPFYEPQKVKEIPHEAMGIPGSSSVDWDAEKKLAASYDKGAAVYSKYQPNVKLLVHGMTPNGLLLVMGYNANGGQVGGEQALIPSMLFDDPEAAKKAKGSEWT